MMRIPQQKLLALVAVAISLVFVSTAARAASGGEPAKAGDLTSLKMDRLDASIDKIVPADAQLERAMLVQRLVTVYRTRETEMIDGTHRLARLARARDQ